MKLKKKYNSEFIFWSFCFAVLFACITYINFSKFAHMNNSDASSEMFEYLKAVVEDKSLIPKSWYNSNELLARRNIYTAIPVYMLTGDLMLTFKINSLITNVLLCASFAFFTVKIGVYKKYVPLALFLFTGLFSFNLLDDQLLFFFMQAYALYAMIIFITLAIVMSAHTGEKKKISHIVCCLISIFMGAIGPKMFLLFYLPLVTVSFMEYFLEYLKTTRLRNRFLYRFSYTAGILGSNLLGLLLYALLFSQYTSSEYYSLSFKPISQVLTEFYKQIVSLLEIFDIRSNGIMKSAMVLNEMYSILLLILCIIAAICLFKYYKNCDGRYGLAVLAVSIVISTVIMGLATFMISQRFYFIVPITAVIILVLFYQMISSSQYRELKAAIALLLFFGVVFNAIAYYRPMLNGFIEERKQYLMAQSSYLQEQDYDTVFATRWNANILSGYSNGKLNPAVISHDTFRPYKFLTNLDRYKTEQDVVFAIPDDEIEDIYNRNFSSIRFLDQGRKIKKIGDINLYYFANNPIREIELPSEKGDSLEYPFWNIDCEIINGKYDLDTGHIVSTPFSEGYVMAGPHIDVEEGIYSLKLFYSAQSEYEKCGTIYVTADHGSEVIATAALNVKEGFAALKRLDLQEKEDVEFKVYSSKGTKLTIEKIVIERVE